MLSDSNIIDKGACHDCSSSDALMTYDDGHSYCFSCRTHKNDALSKKGRLTTVPKISKGIPLINRGSYVRLETRCIPANTCKKYDYSVGEYNGQPVQIAGYHDVTGALVAQKIRGADKDFRVLGDSKSMGLWGSHLWPAGRKIVITEGEIDCLSVATAQGNKFPTVSLALGCGSARKALLDNWSYLSNFTEIILMFDGDIHGRTAAVEAAQALPLGRVKIADLGGYKDANEALQAGDTKAIISAIWEAKEYRPQGVLDTSDLRATIGARAEAATSTYPFVRLNEITRGIRKSSIVLICAGSGCGKTTFVGELIYHLHQTGNKVGVFSLEETNLRTIRGQIAIHLNKNIVIDETLAEVEEIEATHDALFSERNISLFKDTETPSIDRVIDHLQYMAKVKGCTHIVLDHISLVVSTMTAEAVDERRLIDSIMTRLSVIASELNICLFIVSHLKRPAGSLGHEDGMPVRLSELRGSHSLAQLSTMVIGIEKEKDDPHSNFRRLVVLKNRFTGETSANAGRLLYDRNTNRMTEAEEGSIDCPF